MGLFVNSDVILSNAPSGTFGEPKGLEGGRILNDSDWFYVWTKKVWINCGNIPC